MLRLMFVLVQMNRQQVIDKWTRDTTETDARPEDQEVLKKKSHAAKAKAKARRSDLCYVGKALQRSQSSRVFPSLSNACSHKNMMVATGGRSGAAAQYTWLCQGCGSRWERVGEDTATNGIGLKDPDKQVIAPKMKPSPPPLDQTPQPPKGTTTAEQYQIGQSDDRMEDDEIIPQINPTPP